MKEKRQAQDSGKESASKQGNPGDRLGGNGSREGTQKNAAVGLQDERGKKGG
ncbi:hypothetical protein AA313_de0203578 [Arthrobotrys entomopaga]|nr:hypothetical protein AA313_de0203578 [Arthrobotrys entomopaga]